MRVIKAGLRRMAANAPKGTPHRRLLASLLRVAGDLQDLFARASFVEGVMDYSPGVLVGNPGSHFAAARKAIENGRVDDNAIARKLIGEKGMKDREVIKLLAANNQGVWKALVSGADSALPSEGARGMYGEDIAQAVAAGFSPLTGGPLRYGKGKGAFYHLGQKAPGNISVGGLKNVAFKEGKNRAADVLRGTSGTEREQAPADAPVGLSEEGQAQLLVDTLQQESAVPRSTYVDLASAIFNDPWVMGVIDREVRADLRGEVQEAVWTAIKDNPDMLIVKPDRVGVAGEALAAAVGKILGRPVTPQAVGQNFRKKVLPTMTTALEDSAMAKRLLKRRHILEIVEEATKRVTQPHERMQVPSKGVPRSRSGPARDVYGPHAPEAVPKTEYPDWLKKLRSNPDLRALARLAGHKRRLAALVSRFREKQALRMPGRMRQTYAKVLKWAQNNWQQFYDSRDGTFNVDGLAHRLAQEAGNSRLSDDPDHWVWEIAYDTQRKSRWG